MKTKHLLKTVLLSAFSFFFLINVSAQFQIKEKSIDNLSSFKSEDKVAINKIISNHSQVYGIPNQIRVGGDYRLKSIGTDKYDGVMQIPKDSFQFYWGDHIMPENHEWEYIKTELVLYDDEMYSIFSNVSMFLVYLEYERYGFVAKDSLMHYRYYDASSSFEEYYFYTFSYDNQGRKDELIVGSTKYIYEYVGGNQVTNLIRQWYDGTSWVNDTKYIYTYINGRLETKIEQYWHTSQSAWKNSWKGNYEYNSQGQLISGITQDWNSSNTSWENDIKYTLGYTNNLYTDLIIEEWDNTNSVWVNSYKYSSTRDASGLVSQGLTENYNVAASTWEPYRKYIYNHDANGNRTEEIIQEFYGGAWQYVQKWTLTYDNNLLVKMFLATFDASANQMENIGGYEYYYNNNDLVKSISLKLYDSGDLDYSSTTHISEARFNYEPNPVSVEEVNVQDLVLYPNPANDHIQLKMEKGLIENIQIIDALGRTVFASQENAQSNYVTIPTSHLANGIYFLRINNQQAAKSFVVQH